MDTTPLRNTRGDLVDVPAVSATDAKNLFGRVLEMAFQKGAVAITKRGEPKAVLLSHEQYQALVGARSARLEALSAEFDDLLARMQTPASRAAVRAAFRAPPREIGKAAVASARKRG